MVIRLKIKKILAYLITIIVSIPILFLYLLYRLLGKEVSE